MDTTSFDASGITATLNQPLLNVRGQGVLIGFLDTGIDYLREEFLKRRGRTRIAAVWDQTIQSVIMKKIQEKQREQSSMTRTGTRHGTVRHGVYTGGH